jgi:hypothetical protein
MHTIDTAIAIQQNAIGASLALILHIAPSSYKHGVQLTTMVLEGS